MLGDTTEEGTTLEEEETQPAEDEETSLPQPIQEEETASGIDSEDNWDLTMKDGTPITWSSTLPTEQPETGDDAV